MPPQRHQRCRADMKHHRTLSLVAVIALTLGIATAGTFYSTGLRHRTSAQFPEDPIKKVQATSETSRLENTQPVNLSGHAQPFFQTFNALERLPGPERVAGKLFENSSALSETEMATATSSATLR